MKTSGVLLLLVALVGMVSVEGSQMRKRFLVEKDPVETAKETFDNIGTGVDFDTAVQALIPYIHSDMTMFACTTACVGAAGSVLGPIASVFATLACPPLCDAALAELEKQAG